MSLPIQNTGQNTGRLVYKDPEVHSFICQEKLKIGELKKQALQILRADLRALSTEELANDTKIVAIWRDFQENKNHTLFSNWFGSSFEEIKFRNALTGPLLEIFQQCVTEAREK